MKSRRLRLLGFLCVLVVAGCGHQQKRAQEGASTGPAQPVNSATSGTISGKVTLSGEPPTLRPINMGTDTNCQAAHPDPVKPEEVVTGPNGALANVVVYIKSGLGNYSFVAPKAPVVLDQKGCMYEPHVLGLMVGQPMEVKNDDPTTHNVHAMPSDDSGWNKSQPPGAAPIEQTFDHPELAIPIQCNIHPWMKSYAFVFANPYFAVTPSTGTFELKGVPPGTYTIEAWQGKYGTQDQTVTLGARGSKQISFTFEAGSGAD